MLTRWDPFREMVNQLDAMDRFFGNSFYGQQQPTSWGLALDVVEKDDHYFVKASIPGINPDDLDITFTNQVLSIKGEINSEQEEEQARYHLRERRYGRFERSVFLPDKVDADQIDARYEAGVLTLTLPKSEEVKPKRIQIHPGEQSKLIEGKIKEARERAPVSNN